VCWGLLNKRFRSKICAECPVATENRKVLWACERTETNNLNYGENASDYIGYSIHTCVHTCTMLDHVTGFSALCVQKESSVFGGV